jgi:hypothetical protein
MEEDKGKPAAEELDEDKGADLDQDSDTDKDDDQGAGDADKFRKAFEDQKRRAEKAEARAKELEAKGSEKGQSHDNKGQDLSALEKRVVRAELASAGIKDPAEQEFVIGAAKRLGVEPGEAANDPIVVAKLDKLREEKATKDATPSPSKRSGGTTSNISSLADKALKTGELPTDPELRKKVRAEMVRISKN